MVKYLNIVIRKLNFKFKHHFVLGMGTNRINKSRMTVMHLCGRATLDIISVLTFLYREGAGGGKVYNNNVVLIFLHDTGTFNTAHF